MLFRSDVFPDELPGMPPDRDIEFAIEVVPGTNPIFKKHYRMTSPELVASVLPVHCCDILVHNCFAPFFSTVCVSHVLYDRH